jgi:putative SOS response-associated peptidase YedK
MCGRFTLRTPTKARAESVAMKPAYKKCIQKGSVPDRVQWILRMEKTGKNKQPFFIRLKDDEPFAFAGLSEQWHRSDQVIDSATIITTAPNELMEGIHDRMPVILSPDAYELGLEPDFHGQGKLLEMLKPYPAEDMEAHPISTVVNNPRNESAECIEAVRWTKRKRPFGACLVGTECRH